MIWRILFIPISAAYLTWGGYERGWRWLKWLFAEVGGRAYHSQDKEGA